MTWWRDIILAALTGMTTVNSRRSISKSCFGIKIRMIDDAMKIGLISFSNFPLPIRIWKRYAP